MSMTIKELADSLGISKTAVRKRFTDDFRAAHIRTDEKGTIYIDEQGCLEIAATTATPTNPFAETEETAETDSGNGCENPEETAANNKEPLLEILRTSIAALQEQLSAKDAQIATLGKSLQDTTEALMAAQNALRDTTAALTAAQALHAGTIQQQLSDRSASSAEQSEDNIISDTPTTSEPERKRGFFSRLFDKKR